MSTDPLIGALLRAPSEAIREGMLSGLQARGFGDLNASHTSILIYLSPQGLRPSEVAAQCNMSKQAVNYTLGQLEDLEYLERRSDQRDQRFKRIVLTARGQRAVQTMREILRQIESEWKAQLGAEQYAELRTLLGDLNTLVAEAAPAG